MMWDLLRSVHDSCVQKGAAMVCTTINVYVNTKNDPNDTIQGRINKSGRP